MHFVNLRQSRSQTLSSCTTNRLTNCYACWISRFAIGHAKRTPHTAPSFLTPLSFPTWGYAPLNYSNPTYATRLPCFSLSLPTRRHRSTACARCRPASQLICDHAFIDGMIYLKLKFILFQALETHNPQSAFDRKGNQCRQGCKILSHILPQT